MPATIFKNVYLIVQFLKVRFKNYTSSILNYAQHGVGGVPGKAIINNCVHFISEVKRISSKTDLSQSEAEIRKEAALIAALSSNHSWKTYKYLHHSGDLRARKRRPAEFAYAAKDGWKNITESDVAEVKNNPPSPHAFSMWLYHTLDDKHRNEYGQLFDKIRKEQPTRCCRRPSVSLLHLLFLCFPITTAATGMWRNLDSTSGFGPEGSGCKSRHAHEIYVDSMDSVAEFKSAKQFEAWLSRNHSKSDGVWLGC